MIETITEKQEDSPLQSLLEGCYIIQRLNKALEELNTNHDNVQQATLEE
jgi:hypothetical protein